MLRYLANRYHLFLVRAYEQQLKANPNIDFEARFSLHKAINRHGQAIR